MIQRRDPHAQVPTDSPSGRQVIAIQEDRVREEANRLTEQLAAGVHSADGRLALDFAAVNYVRSEDLGALIALHKRVEVNGGRLTLLNVRPLVSGVLSVTRLDTLFDVRQAS
ncbi:MAG TPA: STAS domain-containing protein [Gemmataceae bacterium]|jgi:anti-anti-sigma factor|nr:STAS domain-containing protein [Gemmataceae bacterium]